MSMIGYILMIFIVVMAWASNKKEIEELRRLIRSSPAASKDSESDEK